MKLKLNLSDIFLLPWSDDVTRNILFFYFLMILQGKLISIRS